MRHAHTILIFIASTLCISATAMAQSRPVVPVESQEQSMAEFTGTAIDLVQERFPGMNDYWDLSTTTISETTRTVVGGPDTIFYERVREYWRADGVCFERSTITRNRIDTIVTIKALEAFLSISEENLFRLMSLQRLAFEKHLEGITEVVYDYYEGEYDPTSSVWDAIGTLIPPLQPLIDIANAIDDGLDMNDAISQIERITRALRQAVEVIGDLIGSNNTTILIGRKVVTSYAFVPIQLDSVTSVRAVECVRWIMEIPEGDTLELGPERLSQTEGEQAFSSRP